MSDSSGSESSGLSDWAVVNSQGEVEGSDVDSNTSSIEVVGRDSEAEEEERRSQAAQASSLEAAESIELQQLMRAADAAAKNASEEAQKSMPEGISLPVLEGEQAEGACCAELLPSSTSQQSEESGRGDGSSARADCCQERVALKTQLSNSSSDSSTSSDSQLSLSDISSLSTTSKSSRADSDSDSDFVRLEKESSSVNTESEGEEGSAESQLDCMVASASSVGSGFNFLAASGKGSPASLSAMQQEQGAGILAPLPPQEVPPEMEPAEAAMVHGQAELQPPPPLPAEVPSPPPQQQPARPPSPPPPQPEQQPARPPSPPPQQQPARPPSPPPQPQQLPEEVEEAPAARHVRLPAEQEQLGAAAAAVYEADADDGDTESSTEDLDEDDRIESEQSDDANSAQVGGDDRDADHGELDLSAINDIGDLPVVRGAVERHYIHCNNQHLNGQLNRILLTVILLALGIGLGHWIGSAREHMSQMEIQLAQMKRMHQIQDEYVQCIARNDELLMDYDHTLQAERGRHQEAMSDLRDNNRELQEQLQDTQDQLELVLSARTSAPILSLPHSTAASCKQPHARLQDAKDLLAVLLASDEVFEANLAFWDAAGKEKLQEARASFVEEVERRVGEEKGEEQWKGLSSEEKVEEEAEGGVVPDTLSLREARQQLNNLQTENAELKVLVGKMRYQQTEGQGHQDTQRQERAPEVDVPLHPPPRPIPPPPLVMEDDDDGVDIQVEEETNPVVEKDFDETSNGDHQEAKETMEAREDEKQESQEDKVKIMKHHSAESPKPVPVDLTTLLQRNLTRERQRADMWRHLYLWQRGETSRAVNSSACLHYLSQHWNLSAVLHYLTQWNLSKENVVPASVDLNFLLSKVTQLQNDLMQALPSAWETILASGGYHGDRNDGHHSDRSDGEKDAGSQAQKEEKGGKREGKKTEGGGGHRGKWSDGMKKILNRTWGTLDNVSHQLQQTWGQVKNASHHLWRDRDNLLGQVASKVKDGVSKVKDGVTKLSRKVRRKASRWFGKDKKKGNRRWEEEDEVVSKKGDQQGKAVKKEDKNKQRPWTKKQTRKNDREATGSDDVGEDGEKYRNRKKKPRHGLKKHHSKYSDKKKSKQEVEPSEDRDEDDRMETGHKHHHEKHNKKKHFRKHAHDMDDRKRNRNEKENHRSRDGERGKRRHAESDDERGWKRKDKREHKRHEGKRREKYRNDRLERKAGIDHAKHHSIKADKAAAKAQLKMETRVQRLFRKVGAMSKHAFNRMDREDIGEMLSSITSMYDDGVKTVLPAAGQEWLGCQLMWWAKAEPQRMLYQPMDKCLSYLAPWQLVFVQELHSKLATGHCRKFRKFSCIDPHPEDEEDFYSYVCLGEDGYDSAARSTPKGSREDSQGSSKDQEDSQSQNKAEGNSFEPVNQTAEDNRAWYFEWVQGRNNLRSEEHQNDWLFDRAEGREKARQSDHAADWVFDRAAERKAIRESDALKPTHKNSREQWRKYKKARHSQESDGDEFKQEREYHGKWYDYEHGKKNYEHNEKRYHGKDFRQKYGRTSFCTMC